MLRVNLSPFPHCVTQLKLDTVEKLSSPIFCCLSVSQSVRHRCHPTKSPLFPIYTGIQALYWPNTIYKGIKALFWVMHSILGLVDVSIFVDILVELTNAVSEAMVQIFLLIVTTRCLGQRSRLPPRNSVESSHEVKKRRPAQPPLMRDTTWSLTVSLASQNFSRIKILYLQRLPHCNFSRRQCLDARETILTCREVMFRKLRSILRTTRRSLCNSALLNVLCSPSLLCRLQLYL